MDFDWQERDGKPWPQRFPANTVGGPEWEGATNPGSLLESLERLRNKAPAPRPRPTLFVSHRRDDVDAALEVREVAHEERFDAWLDVLDSLLATPPGQASSLWIGCVIEMALLNSTHLVAVMSKKTNGSQWVPYEFGRVKARLLVAANASSWLVDDMLRGQLPEYLLLCLNTLCGRWLRAAERIPNPGALRPAARAKAQPVAPTLGWGFGEKLRVRGLANTAAGMPTAALADEILLPGDGQVRALFCLGGNPMAAWPDQLKTHAAMQELDSS